MIPARIRAVLRNLLRKRQVEDRLDEPHPRRAIRRRQLVSVIVAIGCGTLIGLTVALIAGIVIVVTARD